MQRVPEPELMGDEAQAIAYARADFEEPNQLFLSLFDSGFPDWDGTGEIADLGCGPADIAYRFARHWPACMVNAVDGSAAMLACAEAARVLWSADGDRVRLIEAVLPDLDLPAASQRAVISNSLLHHLHDPAVMWETVKRLAAPGAPVLVMDLMRPRDQAQAGAIVDTYAADEPQVLRRDFYNSLLAAFVLDEVRAQLEAAGLGVLRVAAVSDRHLCVRGWMP